MDNDYLFNFELLLNLYKKDKNIIYVNFLRLLTENYFHSILKKDYTNIEKVSDNKSFIMKNINNLVLYNINHVSLIDSVNNRLHE